MGYQVERILRDYAQNQHGGNMGALLHDLEGTAKALSDALVAQQSGGSKGKVARYRVGAEGLRSTILRILTHDGMERGSTIGDLLKTTRGPSPTTKPAPAKSEGHLVHGTMPATFRALAGPPTASVVHDNSLPGILKGIEELADRLELAVARSKDPQEHDSYKQVAQRILKRHGAYTDMACKIYEAEARVWEHAVDNAKVELPDEVESEPLRCQVAPDQLRAKHEQLRASFAHTFGDDALP